MASPVYLALGDSMSIDDYTGVKRGGAVRQFHQWLGDRWRLDDRTFDGCRMQRVPTDGKGDVVTLTIGGNDLLMARERYLSQGVDQFAKEHFELLDAVRSNNPKSLLIVGDVYAPHYPLSNEERAGLQAANAVIRDNCDRVAARLAPINESFRGQEEDFLCLGIEPTLEGASAMATLFREVFSQTMDERGI